ncbi:Uncharacterized protein APZ42_033022 [Daphnia magna]|uniref:Uncharacterized protein n=1 Tax=Daphnia magna TaxID=35525 RepID=A0A0N8A928_9CRUS|nr:Uncharacterized protein APZ42_033022 [Daphnia magna]
MEDQLEEKDVLEMGTWNTEYDIAEEEEERLLEEDEITERKPGFPYESEPNFSDTEFETHELEEDILDLGLNEDIIEYEEVTASGQEANKELKTNTPQPHQGQQTSSTTQTAIVGSITTNQSYQKRCIVKSGQPASSYKNLNFKRQPNFPIPVQMRSVPPTRMGSPGFYNQRPLFDGPNRPLIGRAPSVMDYHGPRGGFPRHSMPINCEPLFVQDFHHGFPPQRFQRYPIKDHHLVNHHPFMEYDRNNGVNRLFINPHYQGSATIQNGCTSRVTPLPEPRLNFSHSDNAPPRIAFQARHQRPPPGPSLPNTSRPPSFAPMRFMQPPQSNIPPPRLNGPIDQMSPPRFKPAQPQNLMDMILPAPFGDGPLRASYHPEHQRTQRFRFNSFDPPPPHSYDPTQTVRFLTPLSAASKRPAATEVPVSAPVKQLRLGPTGNIQVVRTFATRSVPLNSPSPSTVTSALPSASTTLTRIPPPNMRAPHPPTPIRKPPPPLINSPRPIPVIPTTGSTPSTLQASVLPTPVVSESPPSSESTNIVNTTEDVSPEMKDYLEKMEEQRKKREEVLKMKEERRRQKLASMAGKDDISPVTTPTQPAKNLPANPSSTVSPTTKVPDTNRQLNTNINPSPFSRLDGVPLNPQTADQTIKENSVSPTLRKTVLVKPTPTVQTSVRAIPQAAVGVNRRYKIIIVKNKSGKILEKRRVPIDEPPSGSNHESPFGQVIPTAPPSLLPQNLTRISETVTIENLNTNATEEYVWKLCQTFGTVQEVYPKLQEGKAIVRFSSSTGAKNFLTNHNTPGICVRFL